MEGLTPQLQKEILGKAAQLDEVRRLEDQKKMKEDFAKGAGALAQIEQDASDAAANAWAKQLVDGVEVLKQMDKKNALLSQEIDLLGKDAQARAAIAATTLQKEEIAPKEQSLQNLQGTSGEQADAKRAQLQEEIAKLKDQAQLIVKKASAEAAEELKAGNKSLEEEIALLGLDAKARKEYNSVLIDSVIATKQLEAAAQRDDEAGKERRKALEEEIKLLREKQQLEGKKFEKQEKVDLKNKNEETSKALSDSISQGILEGFREGESFVDVFLKEMKAQFAKTVLSPIIQPIVQAGNDFIEELMKGLIGSFKGGSGASLAGAGGGADNYNWGGGFAEGGKTSSDVPILVGEKGFEIFQPMSKDKAPYFIGVTGPEIMVPKEAGFIIPHDKIKPGARIPVQGFAQGGSVMGGSLKGERFLASKPERPPEDLNRGASNVTIIQNNQFGSNISRNELANAAKLAQAQAKADIMRSVRLGGTFSR
jgi:hypothetical protein